MHLALQTRAKKYLLWLLLMLLSSCTAFRPVAGFTESENKATFIQQTIKAGDHIAVTKKNGEKYGFEVTSVSEQMIVGEGINIAIKDVVFIHREVFSPGKTLGGYFGIHLGVFSVVIPIILLPIIL